MSSAGAEAVELAASVGLLLDPWQQTVLENALAERRDGSWASFEVGLCVPRQNGKGTILEARELAGLLLFGEQLIIHSAHEFQTALEAMRRLESLLASSSEARLIKRVSRSHGDEGIELRNGSRIKFKTRTARGGRGLSGDVVILDEAMILSSESMKALMPTLSARPNPQIWYAGSAVDQSVHPHGYVFAAVRKRALDGGDPRLCYMEWSCESGAEQTDPRNHAQANPGVGYRISLEYIEAEQRAFRHDPKGFDVERLCIGDWPMLIGDEGPTIDPQLWASRAAVPVLMRGYPQVVAVDRSPVTKMWSIAGAQYTQAGVPHGEIGWAGAATVIDVAERLLTIVADADPVALIIDQMSPAAVLKPHLMLAGVEPVMTNTSELALACKGLLDALEDGAVSHSGQQVLDDSIADTRKRDLPGGRFAWTLRPGGSIVHSVAFTLAHWGLLTFTQPPKTVAAPAVGEFEASRAEPGELDVFSAAF